MKPFKLPTDVYILGFGAAIYQNQEGIDRTIGYVSWAFSQTECKYLAHKLKFLALKSTMSKQFHEYLYGNTFIV